VRLPRSFYLRPALTVARELVGTYLVRRYRGTTFVGRIVEVEAYLGARDPASHSYRGRTPRNDVMFRAGGHLYVYFTYGMHHCANVVTEREGVGHAVLLRALEPVSGSAAMARNRGKTPARPGDLCGGPAKLCQALALDRRHNGTDLCGDAVWICRDTAAPPVRIGRSRRIGISRGITSPWRLFDRDSPYLSRPPLS
jgi:DNA-3-methyladenine glycosylase